MIHYGFDRVYKQGFNIKTPVNIELQRYATDSLRNGLTEYDKRKGWRGPLTNKKYSKNWSKDLKNLKLENSIGWQLAIVKKVKKVKAEIETDQKSKRKHKL